LSFGRRALLQHAVRGAQRLSYSSTARVQERIVVAVGGNALQRRGERLTIENMLKAAADMAPTIAELAQEHELVLTHGNGPQVGELALERSAATFDVLGAESSGQIGVSKNSMGCVLLGRIHVCPHSCMFSMFWHKHWHR